MLMGRRSGADTPAGILLAFHRRRQWRQAELARELGVSPETLLRSVRALIDHGMPLTRDDSDRPNVWWRLPKDWAPAGVLFPRDQIPALLRALARSPRTRERDALLSHVARSGRATDGPPTHVQSASLTEMEQAWLPLVEDAAERRIALGMRYLSGGRAEWRYVSVQRVLVGPPPRFVAVCHRSSTLKWFRVDNVLHARLDPETVHRKSDAASVQAFVDQSVDGFRGEGEAVTCSFIVRDPEASWVRRNLLTGMSIDPDDDVRGGIRIRCMTPGLVRVARFVVGLGGAVRVETPELAEVVRELAAAAFEAAGATGSTEVERVRPKRLKLRGAGR
jgi:predicted DNA-binding transcriptional regulator YafY